MRHRKIKPKRRRNRAKAIGFALLSAAVFLLTFLFKDFLKERAKDAAAAAKSAEAEYVRSLHESSLELRIATVNEEFNALKQQGLRKGNAEIDYSDSIKNDTMLAERALTDLTASFDAVSRLLSEVPAKSFDLKRELDRIKPEVEKTDRELRQRIKPTPDRDWTRAAQIKVAIATAMTQELPILVLGDKALERVDIAKRSSERMYSFAQWSSLFLYAISVLLGAYSAITAAKA